MVSSLQCLRYKYTHSCNLRTCCILYPVDFWFSRTTWWRTESVSSELRPFTFWQSDARYYSALYSQTLPIYVFPLRWGAKFRTQKTNVKIILIFRRQIAGSHINVHWMARNVVIMHSALNLWYPRFSRRFTGICHRVVCWKCIDVSEDLFAPIIRVHTLMMGSSVPELIVSFELQGYALKKQHKEKYDFKSK